MANFPLALTQMVHKPGCMTKGPATAPRRWHRITFWALLAAFTFGLHQPIVAQSAACANLLTDDGLEDLTIWQARSNDDFSLFTSLLTHSGTQAAYLAGRNNAVDRLATNLKLPPTSTITLTFWWQLQSEEEQRFTDQLPVVAVDERGHQLQRLGEFNGRNHSNQWQQYTVDLSKLAGATIGLQFLAQTNDELVTDFFIDDVVVTACP